MSNDYDVDYDDYDYLQNLGESGECGILDSLDGEETYTFIDNPEYYNEDGEYKEPKEVEAVRKLDDWGYEIDETPLDYIEDAEFVMEKVLPRLWVEFAKLDADEIAATARALDHLGYQGFWDTVDSHAIYFEPANAHWRRGQHDDRHYVVNEEGELVPSKYEQVRVRNVLRKLRAQNPDYYRAMAKKYKQESRAKEGVREAEDARQKARLAKMDVEKKRKQEREKKARYRAKKKLLKQQQDQLNQLKKGKDDDHV